MGAIDGKLLNLSGLDIEFEKVNFTNQKVEFNSKGLQVRYEMLELMVRIAGAMFISSNKYTTWTEATKDFLGIFCPL